MNESLRDTSPVDAWLKYKALYREREQRPAPEILKIAYMAAWKEAQSFFPGVIERCLEIEAKVHPYESWTVGEICRYIRIGETPT